VLSNVYLVLFTLPGDVDFKCTADIIDGNYCCTRIFNVEADAAVTMATLERVDLSARKLDVYP